MNTIWSTLIQKAETLYYTRMLRFSDIFKEKYISAFAVGERKSILEIGCGPGALSQALSRWYPSADITGTDIDDYFIDYASKNAPHIKFMTADATKLPFEEGNFDVTISNTVSEHIEPSMFFGEQYRVLKKNGICLVLSARRGINIISPCIAEQTKFECEIYTATEKYYKETDRKYNICAYPMSESELPAVMEKYGFKNVSTEYLTINLTPDNPTYDKETAYAIINAHRQSELDSVDCLSEIAPQIVSESDIKELKRIKNSKYDKRLELYDAGIKQWDTSVSITMIVRGEKY